MLMSLAEAQKLLKKRDELLVEFQQLQEDYASKKSFGDIPMEDCLILMEANEKQRSIVECELGSIEYLA